MTKLSDIADIILGYPFKGRIVDQTDAQQQDNTVHVLQIKDITSGNANQPHKLTTVSLKQNYNKFLLQHDDLVMPVRGGKYNVEHITQLRSPCIAVSQVFIIRCREQIKPAFLYWFLNLNATQYKLKEAQTGTNIPMLNKAALASLHVTLPKLDVQEKIARLQLIWTEQKHTYENLIQNGNQLTQGLCQKLLES